MLIFFLVIIIIQIVTESLPISSSGHILLFDKICKIFGYNQVVSTWTDGIFGVLNFPFLIILIVFFLPVWWPLVSRLLQGVHKKIRTRDSYKRFFCLIVRLVMYVILALGITVGLLGLCGIFISLFSLPLDTYLAGTIVYAFGFIITMCFLFSLRFFATSSKVPETLSVKKVILLGLIQGIAILPGISRLASTYCVARWLGISPRRSWEFSFLMLFPLMVAAIMHDVLAFYTGYAQLAKYKQGLDIFFSIPVILTILCASGVSFFVLRFTNKLVLERKVWLFGFYMIIPLTILLLIA